jgi:hypothetical protein
MTRQISWARVAIEVVAIVGSILLAFAIDAWWQQRQEQSQEHELIRALLDDFGQNAERVDSIGTLHRSRRLALERLLEASSNPASADGDSLSYWLSRLYQGHTVEVVEGTLNTLLSSGQLSLIRNDSLRVRLSEWPAAIGDFHEIEMIVANVIFNDVYPATRDYIPLVTVFGLEAARPALLDQQTLDFIGGRTFENLLTQSVFLERYVEGDAQALLMRVNELVALLRQEEGTF